MRQQLVELQRADGGERNSFVNFGAAPDSWFDGPQAHRNQRMQSRIFESARRCRVGDCNASTSKVESESKYPVKVTGMLFMNGFVNTGAVDTAATPSVAVRRFWQRGGNLSGKRFSVSTRRGRIYSAPAASLIFMWILRQPSCKCARNKLLGLYNTNSAFLRLRTAHAGLDWDRTQVYFALDHPIISPDTADFSDGDGRAGTCVVGKSVDMEPAGRRHHELRAQWSQAYSCRLHSSTRAMRR